MTISSLKKIGLCLPSSFFHLTFRLVLLLSGLYFVVVKYGMFRLFQVDLKAAQHVLRPEPSAGHGAYNHDGLRCQGTASSVAIMDYTDRTDSGEATRKVTTQ